MDLTIFNSINRHIRALSFAALALLSEGTFGQSKTSFGSANANQCYVSSGKPSSLSDARVCTNAIKYDNLSTRDLAATHTNRGIILAAGGKLHEALEDHNKAASFKPNLSKVYINRGTVFHRLNKYEKALIDYQKALDLGAVPIDIVQYNIALSLESLKNHEGALKALRIAINNNPSSSKIKAKIEAISLLINSQEP